MANYMFHRTGKPGLVVVGITLTCILVLLLIHKLLPLVPNTLNFMASNILNLWMLMKRPKFIYGVLNFIILAILISSSFTNKLNNLLLKIRKNSSHHNISSLISHASQKLVLPDDAWWRRLVSNEDMEEFTQLEDEYEPHVEVGVKEEVKTVSFQPEVVEKREEVGVKECSVEESGQDHAHEVENDYNEGGEGTLDDTWKAIMDAKNKAGGPQLKKSGTWSSGDPLNRGGVVGGEGGKKGVGRLAKYKVELKKWRTFSREEKKDPRGGDSGGGSGGGGGGLTYHDELKKRADAFIARFTQDIRLQRLESDQRFLEKLNRGL